MILRGTYGHFRGRTGATLDVQVLRWTYGVLRYFAILRIARTTRVTGCFSIATAARTM